MRFRKKPVEIEAVQWTGTPDSFREISNWANTPTKINIIHYTNHAQLGIDTLEGMMMANVNDWIIRGVAGEFYPCKPDIFEQTYEPI